MTAMASSVAPSRVLSFYQSMVGKKAVVAVTGFIGLGFVMGHLLGNLQFYLGPEALNDYAAALRHNPGLLVVARSVLLLSLVVHVVGTLQLAAANSAARPERYRVWQPRVSGVAARTMAFTGPLLLVFIIFHLMHLTFGVAHPNFRHHGSVPDAYHNVVAGFSRWPASLAYIAAMAVLGMHLSHGVWSLFQSLGANHPRYMPWVRRLAVGLTIFIVLGNISIPVSVLLGLHEEL